MSSEYFSFQDLEKNLSDENLIDQPLDKSLELNNRASSMKPVYKLARLVLNPEHSELEVELTEVLLLLEKKSIAVPVVHITSDSIINPKGETLPTSFLQDIQKYGFRGNRDTNVGGFNKATQLSLGTPKDFIAEPLEFIRDLHDILEYMKHGLRTNKPCLGELKKQGQGVPSMIMIDPTNLPLTRGTDRPSHYQFKKSVSPDRIIGTVKLIREKKLINRFNPEDLRWIASEFLDQTRMYAEKK